MLAVKSMDVRENFKSFCDKVFDGETLIVSRPKNQNIVMMSEAQYNEMMKVKMNIETMEALAEYSEMQDKAKYKRYESFDDVIDEVINEA